MLVSVRSYQHVCERVIIIILDGGRKQKINMFSTSAENILVLSVEYLLTIIIFSNFIINTGTVQYKKARNNLETV